MGYTTSYSLRLVPDYNSDEIIDKLRNEVSYAGACLTFAGNTGEPLKWYDHEADLKKFSKKYPDVRFILHGVGEEVGDIWDLHVQDGKSQRVRAQIIMPEVGELK